MRYFALNFFYSGELFQIDHDRKKQELLLVLNSCSAMDAACERYASRGVGEKQYLAQMRQEHFQYEVRFVDVKAFRVTSRLPPTDPVPSPFLVFDLVELSDAPWALWHGYSLLEGRFPFGESMTVLFRTAHVRPLHRKQLMRHLGRSLHVRAVLSGVNIESSIRTHLARLRERMKG
jgi:hypothetical protein